MIRLLFLRAWGVYNSGETAGFDEATAAGLVQAGVASVAATAEPAADSSEPASTGAGKKPRGLQASA